jgi:hypothetical protein
MGLECVACVVFLTLCFAWWNDQARMKRELRIRTAFEPNRLGAEHCRRAYELLVPEHRRRAVTNASEPNEVRAIAEVEQAQARVENQR